MTNDIHLLRILGGSLVALGMACGGSQFPKLPKCQVAGLEVTLKASQRLNMDSDGGSLSLVTYIFLMKTASALKNADFEAMWRSPKEALGEDLLSMTELTVFPETSETRELPIVPGAGYVAVVGVFRKQTGSTWRAWKRIKTPNAAECKINDEPIRDFAFEMQDYRIEAME